MDRYATLRRGLVGAWCPSLRTGGYALEDRSGVRYNGALVNAPTWSSGAVSLSSASQQYISVWNTAAVNRYSGGAIAVTAWIRPTAVSGTQAIASTVESGGAPATFQLELGRTSGRIGWYQGNVVRTMAASIPAGSWSFVGGTRWFDGSTWQIRLIANGVIESFTDSLPSPTAVNGTLSIGRAGSLNGGYFGGLIDDVRVWNRPLTDSEFALLRTGRGVGLLSTRHRRGSLLSQFWCKVSGTWKTATPWINVGGTWKKGSPKIRAGGAWKG